MKKLILLLLLVTNLFALEVPKLQSYVNDYAGILKEPQINALNTYLKHLDEQTSNQIFILTLDSLAGENLFDYSIKVVEKWRPGQKDKDNGVLLLVAKKERKIRIEVGYGLEEILTDSEAGEIIRYIIVPNFREGNFSKGLIQGIYALVEAIDGDFQPSQKDTAYANQAVDNRLNIIFVVSIFLGIFSLISFNQGKKKLPALWGIMAVSLLVVLLGVNFPFYLLLLLIFVGGPLYAFLAMLLIMLFVSRRFSYYGGGFSSRGGSFRSGGFSGGGGSFGGGGASGSW